MGVSLPEFGLNWNCALGANRKVCSRGRLKETWKSRCTPKPKFPRWGCRDLQNRNLDIQPLCQNVFAEHAGTQDTQRGNFDIQYCMSKFPHRTCRDTQKNLRFERPCILCAETRLVECSCTFYTTHYTPHGLSGTSCSFGFSSFTNTFIAWRKSHG